MSGPAIIAGSGKPTLIDVGRVLDEGRWSPYQKVCVALAALTIVFDGVDNQLLGIAIPTMMQEWRVTRALHRSSMVRSSGTEPCPSSPNLVQFTAMRRGLAFSAFGRTSVITPSFKSAVIRSLSILLGTSKLRA